MERMIILNGSNYRLWKTRMEDFLYVNRFHQPMICSEKPDDKTNEEWNLLNRRVCAFIRHWVDDSVLSHVSEETNARSLLSKLEQLYAPKTLNSTPDDVISVEARRKSENCEHVDKKRKFRARAIKVVRFRSLEKPKKDEFSLELSKFYNYDDVVQRVAYHLNLDDPSKIKLTPHYGYDETNKPQPIEYRGFDNLSDFLAHHNKNSDILYYVLEGLKSLKVAFHHATKDEVVIHTIRLPKESTVNDLLNDLKTKVELSHKDAELRMLEVSVHKVHKIFPLTEKIENINGRYWTLRVEEIPEEEKNLGPQDHIIHIFHFIKDIQDMQVQNFGEPFFLVIGKGETLAEVKKRIQKKLRVPDEEFSKWKLAFLSLGRVTYLQDSDVVYNHFQGRDVYGASEQYIGLEH